LNSETISLIFQYLPEILNTVTFLGGVIALIFKKQYNQLDELTKEYLIDLAESTMTNSERRNEAIKILSSHVPINLKPFIDDKKLGQIVDSVYSTQVKPMIKRGEVVEPLD
jgi:hypothetical protein